MTKSEQLTVTPLKDGDVSAQTTVGRPETKTPSTGNVRRGSGESITLVFTGQCD